MTRAAMRSGKPIMAVAVKQVLTKSRREKVFEVACELMLGESRIFSLLVNQ